MASPGGEAFRTYLVDTIERDLSVLRDHDWLSQKAWVAITEIIDQEISPRKEEKTAGVLKEGADARTPVPLVAIANASHSRPAAQVGPTGTNGVKDSKQVRAKALFDNVGEEEGDLSFKAGGIITNFSKSKNLAGPK